MANEHASAPVVPHELRIAHESLVEAIDRAAAEKSKGNSKFKELCDAIKRFVNEVGRIPGGRDEIRRRAEFVESATGADSHFGRALSDALSHFRQQSSRPGRLSPAAELDAEWLATASSDERTTQLRQVVALRRRIERSFEWGVIDGDRRPPFAAFVAECESLEREAERLEVDGCYWLWHVARGHSLTATDSQSVIARHFLENGGALGRTHLHDMRAAAESLLAWAEQQNSKANSAAKTKADSPKVSTVAGGATAEGDANDFDLPKVDEYDNRVARWIGKRIYLGNDTQIARLFWLLAKPVGRAHSLGDVQRAVEGMETSADAGSTPEEIERAGKRLRKVVAKLRAALREAELDAHFVIHRGGTQNEPEYSFIPRFPQKGSGVPSGG